MQRDTTLGTFKIATILCVVCSFFVAGTAWLLEDRIDKNKELDRQKNILVAAGLEPEEATAEAIQTIFDENITEVWIDLATGKVVEENELPGGEAYDPKKAAKDPNLNVPVENNALMGIRDREPFAPVYKIKSGGYVLPIYGKGLWGTLWGFLALEDDTKTIKGITFYEHKETPGLGAEVDNPTWKSKWPGKKAYSQEGDVVIQVKKGQTPSDSPQGAYTIDGLSGATITTKGVDHLVSYWLGEEGFGKFLKTQQPEPETRNPEPEHG